MRILLQKVGRICVSFRSDGFIVQSDSTKPEDENGGDAKAIDASYVAPAVGSVIIPEKKFKKEVSFKLLLARRIKDCISIRFHSVIVSIWRR